MSKIQEVDPLECPQCKAEMKIISLINERPVTKKIPEHLKLREEPQPQRPPPGDGLNSPVKQKVVCHTGFHYELFEDGWPGYEEPHIPCACHLFSI
ncbi:MAG: hypothetical protein CSA32_02210 [Desulfobulbus propionicus]|nr:MAG: hypothetical protein CSA32_02210 [Desulfobulbus propionicus]